MWLKWSWWSFAIFLSQELVLSATSRRISGEASEELAMSLKRFASFEPFRQLIWMYCTDLQFED